MSLDGVGHLFVSVGKLCRMHASALPTDRGKQDNDGRGSAGFGIEVYNASTGYRIVSQSWGSEGGTLAIVCSSTCALQAAVQEQFQHIMQDASGHAYMTSLDRAGGFNTYLYAIGRVSKQFCIPCRGLSVRPRCLCVAFSLGPRRHCYYSPTALTYCCIVAGLAHAHTHAVEHGRGHRHA